MKPIDADAVFERARCKPGEADIIALGKEVCNAPVLDVIPVNLLKQLLMQYFCVGSDCYTYELTRVKEAYELGTITLDDFVEWDEAQVDDLVSYIVDRVAGGDTV